MQQAKSAPTRWAPKRRPPPATISELYQQAQAQVQAGASVPPPVAFYGSVSHVQPTVPNLSFDPQAALMMQMQQQWAQPQPQQPQPQSSFAFTAPPQSYAHQMQQQYGITPLNPPQSSHTASAAAPHAAAASAAASSAQVWPVSSGAASSSSHSRPAFPPGMGFGASFGSDNRRQPRSPAKEQQSKRRKLPHFLAPQQPEESAWENASVAAAQTGTAAEQPQVQWQQQQQQQQSNPWQRQNVAQPAQQHASLPVSSAGVGIWAPGRSASTAAASLGFAAEVAPVPAQPVRSSTSHHPRCRCVQCGGFAASAAAAAAASGPSSSSNSKHYGGSSHLYDSSPRPYGQTFARSIHSTAHASDPACPAHPNHAAEHSTNRERRDARKEARRAEPAEVRAARVQARLEQDALHKSLFESSLQFMGPLPTAHIPPNHVVRYAQTRAQALELANELSDLLRVALDERAVPGATQALGKRCQCPVAVGLDLEWRPCFIKGQSQHPVALLQIAAEGRVYLFQLIHWAQVRLTPAQQRNPALRQAAASEALGAPLAALLSDPRILKVGVGILGDVAKFHSDYHVRIEGALDLSHYANERPELPRGNKHQHDQHLSCEPAAAAATCTPAAPASASASAPGPAGSRHSGPLPRMNWSLKKLVAHAAGMDMQKLKRVQMSNWEARPLSAAQQSYAAIDAFASLAAFESLHAHHVEAGSCDKGLAAGLGRRPPTPREHFLPVEVAVRIDAAATTVSTSRTSSSSSDEDFDAQFVTSTTMSSATVSSLNGSATASTSTSRVTVTSFSSGSRAHSASASSAKRPFRNLTVVEE